MSTVWVKFRLGSGVTCTWYGEFYNSNQMLATEFVINGSGAIEYFPDSPDEWSPNLQWPYQERRYILTDFNEVTIPESITSLCSKFCNGWYANTLNIGSQVSEIPQYFISTDYAFNFGVGGGIKYIRFPNGCNVTRVDSYAFDINTRNASMYSLIEVDFNDNIAEYGEYCFSRHNKLTKFSDTNNIKGIVGNGAFYLCQSLIELGIESTARISLNTNTFYVNTGTGPDYHDNKLITYVSGDETIINQIDWDGCNRYVVDRGTILRLGHLGRIVQIRGYASGLLPFKHLGRTYYMRECQNGDANQSPLVIRHKGTLHYISK